MNLTQFLGFAGFITAGLLCLIRRKSPWTAIGLINLIYGIECVLGLRHRLHDMATADMGAQYLERAPLQIFLTGFGLFFAGIVTVALLRLPQTQTARLAVAACVLSGTLFGVETVSLHAVDRILYRPIGAALLIGWLWMTLAIATGLAAISSRPSAHET